MTIAIFSTDRIAMSQKERDVLKIMQGVLDGQRTQAQAAHLLDLSIRQVRRIQRKLESDGDQALIHGLRGKPSNHHLDRALRQAVLAAYRRDYHDFGPTFACEKLEEQGLVVCPQTLRRWLIAEGLWERRRRRDPHRSRRPRRECFGELVQMDASIHDWLEGRGEQEMVLISMIDDATSYTLARLYASGDVLAHMDLLGRWMRKQGRPVSLYTDRHSIFEPQDKGQALSDAETQFGRALRELAIELIRARSPQAKGRVERSFGTAQDRVVKEMRLAKVKTIHQANTLLDKGLLTKHNRMFSVPPRDAGDAHRALGTGFNLAAILSLQEQRTVANDYTVRFENRHYQLDKPIYPGERKGKVVIEVRLDGSMAIRFGDNYLKYHEIVAKRPALGGSAPQTPRSLAHEGPTPTGKKEGSTSAKEAEPPGVQPTGGRSGRTSAEPYPPDSAAEDTKKGRRRPAANHPWRMGFKGK